VKQFLINLYLHHNQTLAYHNDFSLKTIGLHTQKSTLRFFNKKKNVKKTLQDTRCRKEGKKNNYKVTMPN